MEVKRNTKAREIAKQGEFGLSSLATPRTSVIDLYNRGSLTTPTNEGNNNSRILNFQVG